MAWNDFVARRSSNTPTPMLAVPPHDGPALVPPVGGEWDRSDWPLLPWARGPLSGAVVGALQGAPGSFGGVQMIESVDPLTDDDFQLALYLCYEVHFRGLADAGWEWDLDLLGFRNELERAFVDRLRDESTPIRASSTAHVVSALDDLTNAGTPSPLTTFLRDEGTLEQFREFCVHRSAHQLKEADPHSFAIARLTGETKAVMATIQFDHYGAGVAARMHSALYADTMTALGLDPLYGSYVENLPGITLAAVNLISMFALHRRWRAAFVGQLAVSTVASIEPMEHCNQALVRLGIGAEGRRFYDARTDASHALATRERMVAGLIDVEPQLGSDLLFGATTIVMLEQRFRGHLLEAWSSGRSSLVPWSREQPDA